MKNVRYFNKDGTPDMRRKENREMMIEAGLLDANKTIYGLPNFSKPANKNKLNK